MRRRREKKTTTTFMNANKNLNAFGHLTLLTCVCVCVCVHWQITWFLLHLICITRTYVSFYFYLLPGVKIQNAKKVEEKNSDRRWEKSDLDDEVWRKKLNLMEYLPCLVLIGFRATTVQYFSIRDMTNEKLKIKNKNEIL